MFSDIITGYLKSLILNESNQSEVPEPQLQSETPYCNNTNANLRGFNRPQEPKVLLGQQEQTPRGGASSREKQALQSAPSSCTPGAVTGDEKCQRDLLLPTALLPLISEAIKLAFSQQLQSCIKHI